MFTLERNPSGGVTHIRVSITMGRVKTQSEQVESTRHELPAESNAAPTWRPRQLIFIGVALMIAAFAGLLVYSLSASRVEPNPPTENRKIRDPHSPDAATTTVTYSRTLANCRRS